jgi:hypothetical protein
MKIDPPIVTILSANIDAQNIEYIHTPYALQEVEVSRDGAKVGLRYIQPWKNAKLLDYLKRYDIKVESEDILMFGNQAFDFNIPDKVFDDFVSVLTRAQGETDVRPMVCDIKPLYFYMGKEDVTLGNDQNAFTRYHPDIIQKYPALSKLDFSWEESFWVLEMVNWKVSEEQFFLGLKQVAMIVRKEDFVESNLPELQNIYQNEHIDPNLALDAYGVEKVGDGWIKTSNIPIMFYLIFFRSDIPQLINYLAL